MHRIKQLDAPTIFTADSAAWNTITEYNNNDEKLISYTNGTLGVTQSYDFVFFTNDLTYDDILNGISSIKKIVAHNKIKIDI